MRKTSHDGGDSTSITSGVENEIKKSAMKPKKSSLKRKAPNFSQESDDTVIEPLLQRDKEKSEPQSAKYFGKGKTDPVQSKESDNKAKTTTTTGFCGTTENLLSFKDPESTKTTTTAVAPLHNYMNTNVFNSRDNVKANVTTKSQILVEIDSSKQSSYTPTSPLIFTTAKIHTDAKTKQMEPVHVTPVPILSTIEVNVSKGGSVITNEKKISNGSSVISPIYSPMPLSKGREEKVTLSSFSTVFSPTINKDTFVKTVPITSSTKLANVTTAQTSFMKTTLPSTTCNSLLMKSNATDKQGDIKDTKKEQKSNDQLQPVTFSSDSTKNNVTVKTMLPSSGKPKDNTITSDKTTQGANSQIQKFPDNMSVNITSNDSQTLTNNNRTLTSQNKAGVSNSAKSISTSIGNKQLQRQKTATEEISDVKSKAEPNIGHSENLSAKISSSNSKNIDSISIKNGKLSNVSANNTQITNNTTSTISKTTSIANVTKPTVTSVVTVTTSADVSSKPSTTSVISNATKIVSPTSKNSASIITPSNVSTTSTKSSTNVTKAPVEDVAKTSIPTSNVTKKSSDTTSIQPQPNLGKNLSESSVVKTSTAKPTMSFASDKNNSASTIAVKTSSAVGKATTTIVTQPLSASTTKTSASKLPSVTTSVKATLASSITSTSTKPSSSTSQVSSSTSSGSVTVKAPVIATSIPKTVSGAADSTTTTSQNVTIPQVSANKQTTAAGINATSKTSPATTSGKSSAANSSIPASSNTVVKSPNNNSSQIFDAVKPSTTSIPKTESLKTLPKTSDSSSTNIPTSTLKSQKEISSSTMNTKDPVASVKKSTAAKTSVATKSPPVSSTNKSSAGTTSTISSSEVSSASTTKKPVATALAKSGSTTTSTKTPLVPKSTKASDGTLSNFTTSATATKTTTTNAPHVSANKSAGSAGSSVPSTTPVKPESDKKAGSKTSENNKDSKVSKA